MSKKVLVVSTSLRKNANSEILAQEFVRGAKETGHEVEKVSLQGREIKFCIGCLACQSTKRCVLHDSVSDILEKMKTADIIVFATPIYFYEMTGQMKTLLDRTNPLFPSPYNFRDIYFIATAADDNESALDGAVKGLQGWIDCFDKAQLKGIVYGTGLNNGGEALQVHGLLKHAYQMGRQV